GLPVVLLGRFLEGVERLLRRVVRLGAGPRRGGDEQGDEERARGTVESLHPVLPCLHFGVVRRRHARGTPPESPRLDMLTCLAHNGDAAPNFVRTRRAEG